MNLDLLIYLVGGFVLGVFIIKRELLTRRDSFRLILGASVLMFLAGLTLHFTAPEWAPACGALLAPLPSLGLFRLLHHYFLKRYKREPVDTWLNWSTGDGADRLFNVAYGVLAAWIWIFTAVIMDTLTGTGR
jgi:hypothetical protein